ncbi:M14 family metallopeptidase [[Enterobacter] lignolyticus]|uniref:Peptidase M14 carboxypeptidase A n=1 Tax=Enterobacter lignolyticus (strain SCF1) TaxID=701347 RepID=E3G141_ENTLS|nr:M14 family metallocarboxypeptidase [[Enterobacter] lignolyticus]ADO47955.1 peptidase M14 carboxypeptidase A [[Enterobacter] lignolyticus SCF1]
MTNKQFYPIGTPGQPWTEREKQLWQQSQTRSRSYKNDVLDVLEQLKHRYEIVQYGELRYGDDRYPLMAAKSKNWDDNLPVALITGGVHGYETSGVMGALSFLTECRSEYEGKLNLLVAPCVSPWAYERIARWNYDAVDPNRQFFAQGKAEESRALMKFTAPLKGQFAVHVDLHETTDTDESEFSPALAARDGLQPEPTRVPDGFYLVSDEQNSRLDFQSAIIAAVAHVTHIAPAEEDGTMLGFPVVSPGIVEYDNNAWHLCSTMTGAPFTTTTEVYPDSAETTPEDCIRAQVVTVRRAIDFALSN